MGTVDNLDTMLLSSVGFIVTKVDTVMFFEMVLDSFRSNQCIDIDFEKNIN